MRLRALFWLLLASRKNLWLPRPSTPLLRLTDSPHLLPQPPCARRHPFARRRNRASHRQPTPDPEPSH
jgi:hypothetical protein